MEDLATSISVNTKTVVEEIKAGGHVLSSDDIKTPGFFPLLGPEGAKAQMELISALEKLLRLATGPWGYLSHLVASSAGLGTLRALVNLNVPQSIPLNGTMAIADLARKTTVSDELLTRLIRYAIANGFLEHAEEGYVRHNSLSAIFAPEKGAADAADCISWELNVLYPSTVKMYESLLLDPTGTDDTKAPLSLAFATRDPKSNQGQEKGSKVGNGIVSKHKESNYNVGNGVDDGMTLWKYHLEHPEQEAKYHNAMTAASKSTPLSSIHAIYGFDWNKVKSVVDVGGSSGTASMAISNAFPHIKFTVQDIGSPFTSGINSHPNITYLEHDFFTPQPTIADVYFLRQILHNWSDENCKKIVQNLIPALRTGSRVIVMDVAIKDSQKSKLANQRIECQNHNTDVIMWTLMGAKERTEKDFMELISSVEPRLKFEGIKTPDGCLLSVLVWRFEG